MQRVLIQASVEVVPTSDFAQTLLDGASLYGTARLGSGRLLLPLYGMASDGLAPSVVDYPAPTDVRDGVDYGNGGYLGNLELPDEADVKDGVFYGANGTEFEGTLAGGGGAWTWLS